MLPEWAAGFWQSKLRYRTQEELLEVAREYHRRDLPLSVIVSTSSTGPSSATGGSSPASGPIPGDGRGAGGHGSPAHGVGVALGQRALVQLPADARAGYLIASERGAPFHADWPDRHAQVRLPVSFYDATNPGARRYFWDQLRANYYATGIKVFWLDACEPEIRPGHVDNLRLFAGPGPEVLNRYPADHARGVYEGMHEAGETEVVNLIRSGLGRQPTLGGGFVVRRHPPPPSSPCTAQVRAGLNVALSGIPWWTTDIGGFQGGEPGGPRLPGAHRALVPVRRVVPAVPAPR